MASLLRGPLNLNRLMQSIAEALDLATRHHQAGELAEAERIYRQILAHEPRHPHALNQLGMLALHANQLPTAIELFTQALRGCWNRGGLSCQPGRGLSTKRKAIRGNRVPGS